MSLSYKIEVPLTSGSPVQFILNAGETLFVLGANGTGKSSLLQRLNKMHKNTARWISAHRQSWFNSVSLDLTPQSKRDQETYISNYNTSSEARWKDDYANTRTNIAIYELVEADNMDARAIAQAARANNDSLTKELTQKDSPIKAINDLLKASNLSIELSIHQDGQILASKAGGTLFSIAFLSDGERNALLIAANVLTAKSGTLILIDEPERHLHRSIISPLLTQLFKKRRDCAFIVSTHDILLPLDNHDARTLLIRGCTYNNGNEVATWDADLVPSDVEMDEVLKVDILGSRKKILFVEGTSQSLDQPFYSLVFPSISVIAKSNCRDVEQAVTGIRGASNLHWLHVFGIVDSDGRQATEINTMKGQGIYAVPAYSVEALYYLSEIQKLVAERHAVVTGSDAQNQLVTAKAAALKAIKMHADRMSEKVAEKAVREEMFRKMPGKAEVKAKQTIHVTIDIAKIVMAERSRLDAAVAANDLDALIARYPIRETPALDQISDCLGFQDRSQYESAVQKLLTDDTDAVAFIRTLFGDLWQDMSSS